MKLDAIFDDSLKFTRATLFDRWSRWVILIVLGLPWALIPYTIDPLKIIDGNSIRFDLIPWNLIAMLAVAGFVLSIFSMGYAVRILRSGNTPPEFDHWGGLAKDGMGVYIIMLIWALPIEISILVQIYLFVSDSMTLSIGFLFLILLLMIIELLFLIFLAVFGIIAIIRFAQTGRMREAFAVSGIWSDIRRIGWFNYFITLIAIAAIGYFFSYITGYLSLIPYAGILIATCLTPLVQVFSYRFIAGVYDARDAVPDKDMDTGETGLGTKPDNAATGIQIIKYSLILVALFVLLISPLILVASSSSISIPSMNVGELGPFEDNDISVYSKGGYYDSPQFTSDGDSILYIATTRPEIKPEGREFGSTDWENDIWIMDRYGNNQSRVTREEDIMDFFPDPSSDRIAYSRYENGTTQVYIMQDTASTAVPVSGPLPYMYFSSWSPDGRRIAVAGFDQSDDSELAMTIGGNCIPSSDTEWCRLYVMDSDGSNPREIAKVSRYLNSKDFTLVTETSWSPDGNMLVSPLYGTDEPGLGVMDATTGSIVQITFGRDQYPSWSPAGDLIAFIRYGNVYTVSQDGSGEKKIVTDGNVDSLTWSPDGSCLAFTSESYLGIIDSDGRNLRQIPNISPHAVSWNPDGETITYTPLSGARIRIMSV